MPETTLLCGHPLSWLSQDGRCACRASEAPSAPLPEPRNALREALEFIANVELVEHRAMTAHESDAYMLGLCVGRAQAALSASPERKPEGKAENDQPQEPPTRGKVR